MQKLGTGTALNQITMICTEKSGKHTNNDTGRQMLWKYAGHVECHHSEFSV